MNDVQAGLKDFDYMGNMESIDELKKQIAVTGAEVNKNSFHEPKPKPKPKPTQAGVNNCIWADHFAVGAVAK